MEYAPSNEDMRKDESNDDAITLDCKIDETTTVAIIPRLPKAGPCRTLL